MTDGWHWEEPTLAAPGSHSVDAPIVAVITRFGLRGRRELRATYRDYERVVSEVERTRTQGLLRSAFLVERPAACFSFSIWADADAIPVFGTNVRAHVEAGNRVFRRLAFDPERGPELWSTKWRLQAVSNNLNWEDFDLRTILGAFPSPGEAAG